MKKTEQRAQELAAYLRHVCDTRGIPQPSLVLECAAALDELGELRRTFCLDRDSEDGLDYVCFEAAGHPGRHVRRWIPR